METTAEWTWPWQEVADVAGLFLVDIAEDGFVFNKLIGITYT
jgi:hypothetical protein